MDKYIGMDMDSKKTVVCVIQDGKKDRYLTIPSSVKSLRNFLQKEKTQGQKVHAAFEISGQAGYLYDHLVDGVDTLKIVNPSKATWIYRTAKKNDRIDARKIAVLLKIGELPTVHMPSKAIRQWRQMILHRQKTVQKVGQVKNRIRALLRSEGYDQPGVSGGWWKRANRQWMNELSCSQDQDCLLWGLQLGDLLAELAVLAVLETQRDRTTQRLDLVLVRHSGGGLLMSIPGVGPRTAEAVLAYTDDIRRFGHYKQYCSYFGLTPKLDESGSTRRLGHISKQGPGVVRWVLCESSWKVVRYCPALRAFYERVMAGQPSRKKIAIVAVARKLLCIMRAMQLTGELFNEKLVREVLHAA